MFIRPKEKALHGEEVRTRQFSMNNLSKKFYKNNNTKKEKSQEV